MIITTPGSRGGTGHQSWVQSGVTLNGCKRLFIAHPQKQALPQLTGAGC